MPEICDSCANAAVLSRKIEKIRFTPVTPRHDRGRRAIANTVPDRSVRSERRRERHSIADPFSKPLATSSHRFSTRVGRIAFGQTAFRRLVATNRTEYGPLGVRL